MGGESYSGTASTDLDDGNGAASCTIQNFPSGPCSDIGKGLMSMQLTPYA